MVVLSVGMRKSGSGWYFNMTNELLATGGGADVQEVRRRLLLRSVIRGNNGKVGRLRWPTLLRLAVPSAAVPSFTVKSHAGPTPSLRLFLKLGLMKATYLYRDPRDVVLSALDHAEAARDSGVEIDLARRLFSAEDALALVQRELERWEQWIRVPDVLTVRYEDLLADTPGELRRLADFLGLQVPETALLKIVERYDKAAYARTIDQPIIGNRLHLNKGVAGRFSREMSPEMRALCEERLGTYLAKMGYA